MATEVDQRFIKSHPDLDELMSSETLMDLKPIESALADANVIFFTPKLRRPSAESLMESTSKLRDLEVRLEGDDRRERPPDRAGRKLGKHSPPREADRPHNRGVAGVRLHPAAPAQRRTSRRRLILKREGCTASGGSRPQAKLAERLRR